VIVQVRGLKVQMSQQPYAMLQTVPLRHLVVISPQVSHVTGLYLTLRYAQW